ncbi:hypothetical protein M9Y10_004438 [Tritrichomonas musculus]|uniref:Uncharacterized protein n=1 Tax=Tritrichomonas musculus TaxID=1915356 RepID=A0ABR2JS87_9EUKA
MDEPSDLSQDLHHSNESQSYVFGATELPDSYWFSYPDEVLNLEFFNIEGHVEFNYAPQDANEGIASLPPIVSPPSNTGMGLLPPVVSPPSNEGMGSLPPRVFPSAIVGMTPIPPTISPPASSNIDPYNSQYYTFFPPCQNSETLNNQPCDARLVSSNQKINSFGPHNRRPKRKINLLPNAQSFKNDYYSILTSRKKFSKDLVKIIHNSVLVKNIQGLKNMDREEFRRIDLYFQNYASKQDQILKVLRDNKDWILANIFNL